MQPKMCTKCKKNIAVVFITKMEAGVTLNEGYCLRCARSLGIPQIDQAVRQMGISEEDLDMLSDEMSNMFGQRECGGLAVDLVVILAIFPLAEHVAHFVGEHIQIFFGNTHLAYGLVNLGNSQTTGTAQAVAFI